jgi:hypothetical protein
MKADNSGIVTATHAWTQVSEIAISLEQAAILVLGERLVLTFRCPMVSMRRDEIASYVHANTAEDASPRKNKARRNVLKSTRVHARESPFAKDDSGLRTIYEEVRLKIQQRTSDTSVRPCPCLSTHVPECTFE